MKKFTLFLDLLLCIVVLASCKGGDEPNNGGGITSEFTVNTEEIAFLRDGSEQVFRVVAGVKPTVTSDASWLHVGEIALNGTSDKVYNIPVSADANGDYDVRTATLTVTAGSQTATVKATQRNAVGILLKSDFSMPEIPAAGQQVRIPVLATGDYTVTASDAWIEVMAGTRALAESDVTVNVTRNRSTRLREGSIVFTLAEDNSKTLTVTVRQAASQSEAGIDMTAFETAKKIDMAINIGNTLEAIGGETAWGAAKINRDYISGIVEAGFTAVRLPVAWYNHCDKTSLKIDADWMSRVEEVVNLCVENGLMVFMNIHWDEGWMEQNIDRYDENVDRIQRELWTQIADRFNYFDGHLVFCGANEAGKDSQASADALKAYMQTFIDVVRASGGNNARRVLVVQAPGTDINNAVKYCSGNMPNDVLADKLMLEVHCYDPSNFTIMGKDNEWGNNDVVRYFWGKDYHSGTNRDCDWGEESHISAQMKKLKDNFVDKGVPVIMGEFGCGRRTSFVETIDEALHRASRCYYHKYMVQAAKDNGVVPFLWDTPNGLYNRQTGTVIDPDNLKALQEGAELGKYPY